MDHKVRPAQDHPSPSRGVEGSRRVCTEQESYPQPCPPASPSGVEGKSRRPAGSQQIHPPPRCSPPSRTAPTWAEVARGVDFTHQEAPAASSANVITLYKRYSALGLQASFSVKSGAVYEEASLSCPVGCEQPLLSTPLQSPPPTLVKPSEIPWQASYTDKQRPN
jgi:hypothetical protein